MSPSWTDKDRERLRRLRNADPRIPWEKFQKTYFPDRSKDAVYMQWSRLVHGRPNTQSQTRQDKVTLKHSARQAIKSLARKRSRPPGRQLRSGRVNGSQEDDDSMKEDSEDDEKTTEEAPDQDSSENNKETSSDEDASNTEGEERVAAEGSRRRTRQNLRSLRKRAVSDSASDEEATDDDAGDINFNGGVCPVSLNRIRSNSFALLNPPSSATDCAIQALK
ncbi:hypothetical protein BDW69DRAFT_94059 [Aspergillus filifer]